MLALLAAWPDLLIADIQSKQSKKKVAPQIS
jgi:hypothetical protein